MDTTLHNAIHHDMMQRRIAHLDMDAFYASVELLRYPELQGMPVVVAGHNKYEPIMQVDGSKHFFHLHEYTGRGVITTATYEARAAGISSGMGVMKAARLLPDAVLLPVNFAAYRHYSKLFKAAAASIVPHIENIGIDEIYMDLTMLADDTRLLARRIKCAIHDATGLSCSIGVAPNKLLAKICSGLEKPDGITIIDLSDIPDKIWPLPVNTINGIGPKMTKKLTTLGITTIAKLAHTELSFLQTHFSYNTAIWLHNVSHGIDHRPVKTQSAPKSISREITFERDLHPRLDRLALSEAFTALCTRVADDLNRKGYAGRTIGIKLRFEDFQTITRDATVTTHLIDSVPIQRAARECLKRVTLTKKLRLLGVKVSSLVPVNDSAQEETTLQKKLPLTL